MAATDLLTGILATSVGLSLVLGPAGGLVSSGPGARPCALIELVDRGLDLGTPFLPRLASAVCSPTTTAPGVALTVVGWVLQLAAWALATLFVAGFTGIVRKA